MPAPIDYLGNVPDPMAKLQQGLQLGSTIRNIQQQTAAADEAARQREAAVARQKQYGIDLEETMNNPTPTAFANLTLKYPQQREAFKQAASAYSEEQVKNEMVPLGQIYAALQGGSNDVALSIADEQITAFENSGKDATNLKMLRSNMEKDPKSAQGFAGLMLSSIMEPKEFAKTFKTIGETSRAKELQKGVLLKQAQDLELSQAQTTKALVMANKLGIESQKVALELEAAEKAGGIDPDKKFDQEKKLRDEYSAKTKDYRSANVTLEKIKSSAKDASGAGDLALVFSFMKMLDPGSVVRESEFALARDTAGLFANLQNQAEKIQSGQFLTPRQRKDFERLASQYMTSTAKHEQGVKKSLNAVIKNYKLEPDNIFGGVEEVEVVETPTKGYLKYSKGR